MAAKNTKEISTKEVIDAYFGDKEKETEIRVKPQVDKQSLYDYEKEIGKKIFEIGDEKELFGLLSSLGTFRPATYRQIISIFRPIWEYYGEHYSSSGHIRNPWNRPEFKGYTFNKKLVEYGLIVTSDTIKYIFREIDKEYQGTDLNYGEYLKCIIMLFYNGFATAKEIVTLQESMINFKSRKIKLDRATIQISDGCLKLLEYVHSLDEVKTSRRTFSAESYHGGYFKIAIDKAKTSLQSKSPAKVGEIIMQKLSMNIKYKMGLHVDYRDFYLLGFYDYIVNQAGESRTQEILTSVRNREDAEELMGYADEYGLKTRNVTYIKNMLNPFILVDKADDEAA